MLQGATVSSISTVLPRSGEKQAGAQPPVGQAGGQARGCRPPSPATSHLPWILPASLEERRCWALPASFLSQEVQEERFFPQQVLTGLALTCPREIWQKCPPASYDWETGSVSLSLLKRQPPGPLLTPSVSAHVGGLTLRRLLCTLMRSPASAFQPPGPKPKGTDLALLSLSYFNRDRPGLALMLRAETRSGAGTKLTPARWVQPKEPSPSIKV